MIKLLPGAQVALSLLRPSAKKNEGHYLSHMCTVIAKPITRQRRLCCTPLDAAYNAGTPDAITATLPATRGIQWLRIAHSFGSFPPASSVG
jgi:hypothetical protein